MNQSGHDIAKFMAENLREFRPIAYFDKHMDCIRVKLKDCRVVEVRLNRLLTVLVDYDAKGGPRNVGFTIKGVAHLFSKLGLERDRIYTLVEILNRMLEKFPDHSVRRIYEEFSREPTIAQMPITLKQAA